MKVRIYYKDTDMGGIVYHSNYLNFCEMARSELFFSHGRSPMIGECHFAIKKINANYHKPSFLGDLLEVKTKLIQVKHTSIEIAHAIYRADTLIFTMEVLLVFLCKDGKPHRIDEETKAFFKQLPSTR
ncbi:MAG: YbgC/FadM family acyl-CoA thioesterase [Epsilonproteobacteria bacterium]|nr:YbgC/FadM family acyl-CoA thioesterase [Campylobacterota bacterium]